MRSRRFSIFVSVAVVAAVLNVASDAAAVPSTGPVFINEIHYNDAGSDTAEGVEIAGPAGTDLTGWMIVFYNGSNNRPYSSNAVLDLSGTIPSQQAGFGTRWFLKSGIQNGAPDAMALVNPSNVVTEFISYEGIIVVADDVAGGVARGLTSTDIGVAETGDATEIDMSLQLTGTGTVAADFTWAGPQTATRDTINTGQSFELPPPFINEIHYDNAGTDDVNEGVEIAGRAGTVLTGWTVVLYNGSDQEIYNTNPRIALSGTIPDQQAGFGTLWFPHAGIQNGAPDAMALVGPAPDSEVIEFISYEGSFEADGDEANGLTSTDIDPDTTDGVDIFETSNTPEGHSLQLTGAGSESAHFTWAAPQMHTRGAVNTGQTFALGPVGPAVGDLVINEIMADPSAVDDSQGEWFEIFNRSDEAIDINGWTISDSGSDTHTIDAAGGSLEVPSEGFVVLGNNAILATNGGVAVDYGYSAADFTLDSADEIILTDADSTEYDRVAYDGGVTFPDPAGASLNLTPGLARAADNDEGTSWCTAEEPYGDGDLGTPGAANSHCTMLISTVQGTGGSVRLLGNVTVEAIVTSLFTSKDVLNGFFIQEEDADNDRDPKTSEGIFVYCDACEQAIAAEVAVGDRVAVTGEALDFFDNSQIDIRAGAVEVESSGNRLPSPTRLSLPASGSLRAEYTFEDVESMLVTFPQTLVVSEYFQLGRFGQVVLSPSRPYQFTHRNVPSASGYAAFLADLDTKRIILDDDNNDQNDFTVKPYPFPEGGLSNTNRFRGGDSIRGLTGVMHWSFGGDRFASPNSWRIRAVPEVYDYTFAVKNPRPSRPPGVGGSLKVASFNVLNYFTTLDNPGNTCGPSNLGCRGAHSAAELTRQTDKIVAAMTAIDADITGLLEIENDTSSVGALVDALNTATSAGTYGYIATGTIGGDAIKVGLIYQPGSVAPVGNFKILDSSVDPAFIDTKNRPALIQTFEKVSNGERLTIAVNHLKSKGSSCTDVGDPDLEDGQANCSRTRTKAASALARYLDTDPTGSGDPDKLIIGDLNAYAREDAITVLKDAGYTDLIRSFVGSGTYSFVFDSQLGYLDHALANASLLPQVTGVGEWHINSDEVNLFDYNDDILDAGEAAFEQESGANPIYEANAFRSSDHDPVIIGLSLGRRLPPPPPPPPPRPPPPPPPPPETPVDAPVVETPFTDLDDVSPTFRDNIARIFGLEITLGTSQTTFSPNETVTRQQMATFLARLYKALTGVDAPVVETPFTDLDDVSPTFRDNIARMFGLEITLGTSQTTFSPNETVTRQQMATFLARLYKALTGVDAPVVETPFTDLDDVSPTFRDNIARMFGLEITLGTPQTTFSPNETVTRQQMATFLARLYKVAVGIPAK